MLLLPILAMLLLFSLSIFVHELGHFLVARAFGMVADVFSIGMGKALWKRKVGETSYQIGWLPFGGYVALPQMDPNSFLEGKNSEAGGPRVEARNGPPDLCASPRALPRVAPWKKIIVSLAGAAGNLIFAFLLATIVWIAGKPASLQEQNGVIGYVATNSAARAAGLAVGDEIVAVDGRPVHNWTDILSAAALAPDRTLILRVQSPEGPAREVALATEKSPVGVWLLPDIEGMDLCHVALVYPGSGAETAGLQPGDQILRFDGQAVYSRAHLSQLVEAAAGRAATVEFRRGGKTLTAAVASTYDPKLQRHLIGIQFNTLADLDYATRAHPTPWAQMRTHAGAIFSFLGALTTPATSGAAAGAVGGPVLILIMLWLMLKSSFILAIWFTGFLNVNLAILNLLPLPLLDGGHVVLNAYEGIVRRPPPPRLVNALVNLFAGLFIVLFLTLIYRDSMRHLVPPVQRWLHGEAHDPAVPGVFQTNAPAQPPGP